MMGDDPADDVAMADTGDGPVAVFDRDLGEGRAGPLDRLRHALSAGRPCGAPRLVPFRPGGVALDLVEGDSGPVTEVDLVQPLGDLDLEVVRLGDRASGIEGALSRARI